MTASADPSGSSPLGPLHPEETRGKSQHDFDPVTWKCRRCTVRATEGIVVCHPYDPDAPEERA